MTQQNAVTKKLRNIRICTGVPSQWESCPSVLLTQSDKVESFYVEETDALTFSWVTHILQDTGHAWDRSSACACMKNAKVKSIHRIENMALVASVPSPAECHEGGPRQVPHRGSRHEGSKAFNTGLAVGRQWCCISRHARLSAPYYCFK